MAYKPQYSKSLETQLNDIMIAKLHAGEGTSRHAAKKDGSAQDKIFAYKTFRTYMQHGTAFIKYLRAEHSEEHSLKHAIRFVPEYLKYYAARTDSASSVKTARAALNKLYGIKPGDKYYVDVGERKRADYKRSRRDDTESRTNFSELNHRDIVHFELATGCRRQILENVRGSDYKTRSDLETELKTMRDKPDLTDRELRHIRALEDALTCFPDKQEFLHHRGDKGGKERIAPFAGQYAEEAAARARNTAPGEKIFLTVPSKMDVHGYRNAYSCSVYREYARPIEEIPYDRVSASTGHAYQSDVYVCRGDRKGERYDKKAMYVTSVAMGHNRISCIAQSYLRGV